MIISAKSLSGEYISIEIQDNSTRIEEEFEQKYKELYVDRKLRPFISVKLFESAVIIYEDEKGNEEVKSEWSFLVNTHKIALCIEKYKDCWMSMSRIPHPYVIEMFENLDEDEKQEYIYEGLSTNPIAIEFFLKHPDKIVWKEMLKYNSRVSEVIHLYPKLTFSQIIKYSPNSYELICSNLGYDQIDWDDFLDNKHIQPEWVQYVIDKEPSVWGEHFDNEGESHGEFYYTFKLKKKHWKKFSKMPVMIPLLRKYMDKICWKELCENPCPEAIDILRENRDKVIVSSLCENHTQEAVNFLEEICPDLDINKKSWSNLCRNPYALHILERYTNSIKYLELAHLR